jgi:hypothetical protein
LKVPSFDSFIPAKFRQVIGTHLPTIRGSQQVALIELILGPALNTRISEPSPSKESGSKGTLRSIQGRFKGIYPKLFPSPQLNRILDKLQDFKGKSIFSILIPTFLEGSMNTLVLPKIAKVLGLSRLWITRGSDIGVSGNDILYPIDSGKIDVNFSHASNIAYVEDNSNISGQESKNNFQVIEIKGDK